MVPSKQSIAAKTHHSTGWHHNEKQTLQFDAAVTPCLEPWRTTNRLHSPVLIEGLPLQTDCDLPNPQPLHTCLRRLLSFYCPRPLQAAASAAATAAAAAGQVQQHGEVRVARLCLLTQQRRVWDLQPQRHSEAHSGCGQSRILGTCQRPLEDMMGSWQSAKSVGLLLDRTSLLQW